MRWPMKCSRRIGKAVHACVCGCLADTCVLQRVLGPLAGPWRALAASASSALQQVASPAMRVILLACRTCLLLLWPCRSGHLSWMQHIAALDMRLTSLVC